MDEKTKPTTIFTVLLADGSNRQHLYETSLEVDKERAFFEEKLGMIRETMVYGKGVLVFNNPTVWSDPGNVLGVEMVGIPQGK